MQKPVSNIQLAENKLSDDCKVLIGPATMAIRTVDAVLEIDGDPEMQAELFADVLSCWIYGWSAVIETMHFCVITSNLKD